MTKEILNFKNQSLFDRLFITNYFVAIIFLIFNCVVSTYLPHNNEWYGFWNDNQSVSILGIITLTINCLFSIYFISFSIARFIKKPWIANLEEKRNYDQKNVTYFKFNIPVMICLWIIITIGLINKPGLIILNVDNTKTISLLFLNYNKYFSVTALVIFIIIAMLWLGILTQLFKDIIEFKKIKKQQRYAS